MQKPESVQENETHKILRDFGIKTDLLIPAWRPDVVFINEKRICILVDFTASAGYSEVKEGEMLNWYLDLARELNKLWNMKVVVVIQIVAVALELFPRTFKRDWVNNYDFFGIFEYFLINN